MWTTNRSTDIHKEILKHSYWQWEESYFQLVEKSITPIYLNLLIDLKNSSRVYSIATSPVRSLIVHFGFALLFLLSFCKYFSIKNESPDFGISLYLNKAVNKIDFKICCFSQFNTKSLQCFSRNLLEIPIRIKRSRLLIKNINKLR